MAESHVITGLVAKRSELSGLVKHHRKELARISEEIKMLDATIRLFDPDYRTHSLSPSVTKEKTPSLKMVKLAVQSLAS